MTSSRTFKVVNTQEVHHLVMVVEVAKPPSLSDAPPQPLPQVGESPKTQITILGSLCDIDL